MPLSVLNFASFIPVSGLPQENDISIKIYADLKSRYGVESEFYKPVPHIPSWMGKLTPELKKRQRIFSSNTYRDVKYGIKVNFPRFNMPFQNKLSIQSHKLAKLDYLLYGRQIEKSMEGNVPDLLHGHALFPDGYIVYRLSKKFDIPYILTVRGGYTDRYITPTGKTVMASASYITTPSYRLYDALSSHYSHKLNLLPHGLDDEWFESLPKKMEQGKLRLVTVSRLLAMKNIQTVIQALPVLRAKGYDVIYHIIGDGDYERGLKQLAADLGVQDAVLFHGFRDASYIRQIYKETDVFVMLSYPETFGRVYFEAAAQGLYVIGVKDTGAHGYLTDEEGNFINIDKNQLVSVLTDLTPEIFALKTKKSKEKMLRFKNDFIIEKYYRIIQNIKSASI
ncbi:glycosyltransferase family 4 protein [Negadavirga shengliensis]|uniref:Glycosyltransferase family 4 protein n=1 Tax=Negadavirga shengliensis TaxID=1389218 RepID=A0ABV9SYT7_9BACT